MSNLTNPLVTIVTPSYNQGRFIRDAIDSVLTQDYDNVEYIVMDGGSTDETLDILKEYGDRLKWISEPDNGQSDAINKGFKMASGEIVAWLNSDDSYKPGAIRKAVEYFLRNDDVALVYGDGDIIDENNRTVKRFEWTQPYDLWTLVNYADYIMQPTTFFRRRALENVGFIDETLNWCMDWDLWIRIGLKYDVAYIDNVFANSREYEQTKTSTGGWPRFSEISALMRKYSNRNFPPGYFVYGAATLYSSFKENKIMSRVAQYILFVVTVYFSRRLSQRYRDAWIGKRFKMIVKPETKTVSITGDVPIPQLRPQCMRVYVNGRKQRHCSAFTGEEFSIQIGLDIGGKGRPGIVEIECDRTIVPSRLDPASQDNRTLGVRILKIEVE